MTKKTYPTLKLRSDDPAGARITELTLGDQNLMERAFSLKLDASVDSVISVEVGYRALIADIEVPVGKITHRLLLQKKEWTTNDVDGETEPSPHIVYQVEEYAESGLPEALRKMADSIEAEMAEERKIMEQAPPDLQVLN